jgi:hypothetical protein
MPEDARTVTQAALLEDSMAHVYKDLIASPLINPFHYRRHIALQHIMSCSKAAKCHGATLKDAFLQDHDSHVRKLSVCGLIRAASIL